MKIEEVPKKGKIIKEKVPEGILNFLESKKMKYELKIKKINSKNGIF